ncbi:hypothetical protein LTS08_004477 [Lithohypha guttulata]|uniref:RNase III domain-containing protein n=1 Tax=Lithohypha guttulata TaxID=1690604 RepID=A0AAN7STZ9_9EURO|nr:hypothetical protein LTR05_008122 [Lithohypha guttulata]KAK5102017.1 hypothetical protein LTS08_004477 [Lithohypha guttulata]
MPSNNNVLKPESSLDSYAIPSTSSRTDTTSSGTTSRKSTSSSASTISIASSHTYVNDGFAYCAEVAIWDRDHQIAAPHVLQYLADHKQLDIQQYAEAEKEYRNGVYLDDAVSTVTLLWINADVARRIAGIEQMCDYVFRDKSLCLEAITPATWCRPAVLGDSVQKTILADQWKRATSLECTNELWTEELANKVLCNRTLGRRGTALNLLDFAYLGLYPNDDEQTQRLTKEQQGNKAGKEDDVASMVEAIFGAVYQDSGSDWRPVFKVMLNLGIHLTSPESTHAGVRATINQRLLQEHLELAGCGAGGIS